MRDVDGKDVVASYLEKRRGNRRHQMGEGRMSVLRSVDNGVGDLK